MHRYPEVCSKSSYSPASKAVCPLDPQEEWLSSCVTVLKDKHWMWENIPGEKLIGTWERYEDYLFVYHNWARKKKKH